MIKVGGLDFAPNELATIDDDQDDTEIRLPEPPAALSPALDELLLKVSAIAGWKNIAKSTIADRYFGTKDGDPRGYPIPRYDLSIDIIWSLYEQLDLFPTVERLSRDGRILYNATLFKGIAPESYISTISLPMALCNLLIAIAAKIE